jgi:hypothetical protein
MTDPTDPNHQFLTTLANLGIASHRLDQIRDAARLHRQQLIGSSELYAVIEADSPATPAVPAPATGRAAVLREAADELGRMDYDTDSNDYGYDGYRDAWNGGVMDAAALLRRLAGEAQQDEALPRCTCGDTACESELCDCGSLPCPVDHAREAQQDPTQDGTAPRPATVAWDFEGEYEAGKWHGIGNTYRNHDQALAYLRRRAETDKQHRRISMVRATTTYTVEETTATARPGQPETDQETQS